MENSFFKDLNIENLRDKANQWATDFSAIKELTLYRGDPQHGGAIYVLVAIYDEQDEKKRRDFLNWQNESAMHIQDTLPTFYNFRAPKAKCIYDWAWFSIPVGQPLALSRFICKSPVVKLFPYHQDEEHRVLDALAELQHSEAEAPKISTEPTGTETSRKPEFVIQMAKKGMKFTQGPKHKRMDNLGKAMKKAWEDFIEEQGSDPSCFEVWDWIPEERSILEKESDTQRIHWKRSDGTEISTSYKSFQNRYTVLKKKLTSK
jgi:hypothetical protein